MTGRSARAFLRAMTTTRKVLLAAAGLLVAIQVVPVERTNPPVEAPVVAPPEVAALLRRACFDCHSHETIWPAQAYVAPVSWLVSHDVSEGREELNFSRWGQVDLRRVAKKLPKEVEEKEMPPWFYVVAHPEAKLTDAERATLAGWGRSLGGGQP